MPEELEEDREESQCARPKAQDIFTDRKDEQEVVNSFLSALREKPHKRAKRPLLSFYGVGGVGKTTLLERVGIHRSAKAVGEEGAPVRLGCATCNIDLDEYTPDYIPMQFYGRTLRPALHAAGFKTPLFDVLYLAWWGQANPNQSIDLGMTVPGLLGVVEKGSETASVGLSSFAELLGLLASGLKAVDLGVKAWNLLKTRFDAGKLQGLFSDKTISSLTEKELQELAPGVIARDLRDQLQGDPNCTLCIVIDGFERIQSHTDTHNSSIRRDLQWSIQSLFGILVQRKEPVGMIIFGRETLDWRRLFDPKDSSKHWDLYIESHILEALSERDAEDFINKVLAWCERTPDSSKNLGAMIGQFRKEILDSAEETPGQVPHRFHPYSLDLAIDQIAQRGSSFTPDMLGRGAADLQLRFLRYMDATQRKSYQVLALALEFDQGLFEFLVDDKRLGYQKQDFHALVGRGTSYIREVKRATPSYSFHRKMQEALFGSLELDYRDGQHQAIQDMLTAIVGHRCALLGEALRQHNDRRASELYDLVATVIVEHAAGGRLAMPHALSLAMQLENGVHESFNLVARIAFLEQCAELAQPDIECDSLPQLSQIEIQLALLLNATGRHRNAKKHIDRALVLVRDGIANSDTEETRRMLARCVSVAGSIDEVFGNLDAAVRLYAEALVISRAFAKELGNSQNRYDLSICLDNIARIDETRGDLDSALGRYTEGLEIRRALAKELDIPETRRELSISLDNIARIDQARSDLDSALGRYTEGLEIRRALARELGNAQSRRDLSISLKSIGKIEATRGDLDSALGRYTEALEIDRALARELGNPQSRRDLSISFEYIAGIEEARGDLDSALGRYTEGLEIRRALAKELDIPESRRDLSTSLNRIGKIEATRGDLDYALGRYTESLEIARALAKELGTPQSRRDLSISFECIAGIEEARGDLNSALHLYREALEIRRALVKELNIPESRRDLSISLNSIGKIEATRGDLDSALGRYTESLEIARVLAKELGNPQSRRDLSMIIGNIALIEADRGDLDSALVRYTEALEIDRTLAKELGNPQSRRDLSMSIGNVALIEAARGDLDSALGRSIEALEIRRALAKELGNPQSHRDLISGLGVVAEIHVIRSDLKAALAHYDDALKTSRTLAAGQDPSTLTFLSQRIDILRQTLDHQSDA